MNPRSFTFASGLLALSLGLSQVAYAQARYSVAVIGGAGTSVFGISRDGLKTTGQTGSSAFFTNNNTTPILSGPGRAFAITDYGEHVGDAPFGASSRAVYRSGTSVTDLGTLGGSYSMATGINTSFGNMVGVSDLPTSGVFHAFRRPFFGAMQDLGTLVGNTGRSWASFITEEDVVLGQSDVVVGGVLLQHACQWNGAAIQDLDPGSPYTSVANAATHSYTTMFLNGITFSVRNTHSVGSYYPTSSSRRARIWTTNNYSSGVTTQNLPPLVSNAQYSEAIGINTARTIVGYSDITNGNPRACRWQNGVVANLNTLMVGAPAGTVLIKAKSISESGKIVVQGTINGVEYAFLLTPQ